MSGLKFTLSDVTSFLPDNLSGLKKNYNQVCNMVFKKCLIFSIFEPCNFYRNNFYKKTPAAN